jgi:phospholipid/cholesterol/gamma-HCH transport system substrate-binding protein
MQSAAKVGLLVVIFVALFFGVYAVLGVTLLSPKRDTYFAEFDDAGGLGSAAVVLMSGVKIGTVTNVGLMSPQVARVTFEVRSGVNIPDGSVATISTQLINLGEMQMHIVPPETVTTVLNPGSTLPGKMLGPLDAILPDTDVTMRELNATLAAVRKILEDERLMDRVDTLMAATEGTVNEFGSLARTTNRTLTTNEVEINRALVTANQALLDVRRVTNQVALLVEEGTFQREAQALMTQVREIATSANQLVVDLNGLVNDPNFRGTTERTLRNVEQISGSGVDIAENTRQITEEGVAISKNVNELTQRAINLTETAQEIAEKANVIADQVQESVQRVTSFLTRPGPNPLANVGLSMDVMRQSNPGYWRTDLGFTLPVGDGTIHAGVFDAFGSNRLTLQFGKEASDRLRYRYGIYAAQPGIGVDYVLAPRLSLRGDVWDINRLRVDLRARYDFGGGVIGWLGIENLADRPSATIGIGLRR